MSRKQRLVGTLCAATFALVVLPAASALAATFTHYGGSNAGGYYLSGRSVAGSSGSLPNDFPGPKPWNLPAGDYCSAYKFEQPSAPATSAPLATVSNTFLGDFTGFDPGTPREAYQMRHNGQADSSACQVRGDTWGFWTNSATNNNYCSHFCGVRHDYSTGQATGTRPWSNGYGPNAKLVMSAHRFVRRYQSSGTGISYICAILQDTTTGQYLEHCLRVWRSYSGPAHDEPIVFHNPQMGTPLIGTAYSTIVTDITAGGTPYAQNWGGATTVLGTNPSGQTYSGAITRGHLVNAINDANNKVKAMNAGLCLGVAVKCYSTDPDKYALFGVSDGLEIRGTGHSHMGGHSSGLRVYTDY